MSGCEADIHFSALFSEKMFDEGKLRARQREFSSMCSAGEKGELLYEITERDRTLL